MQTESEVMAPLDFSYALCEACLKPGIDGVYLEPRNNKALCEKCYRKSISEGGDFMSDNKKVVEMKYFVEAGLEYTVNEMVRLLSKRFATSYPLADSEQLTQQWNTNARELIYGTVVQLLHPWLCDAQDFLEAEGKESKLWSPEQ